MNKTQLSIISLVAIIALVTGTVSIAEAQQNDLNLPDFKLPKNATLEKLLDKGKPIENFTGAEDINPKNVPGYLKYAPSQKEFGDYGVEKVYKSDSLKPIRDHKDNNGNNLLPPEFTVESKNRDYSPPKTLTSNPGFELVESIREQHSITTRYTDNNPDTPDVYTASNAAYRVADYNGEYSAPYYIQNEDTFVQVETAEGSFTWDKNTCAVTFYESGLIEAGENPLIGSDSLEFYTTTGNSPNWQEMVELNNASCTTEVLEDGYNVEVRGTKIASDAEVIIRYIKVNGELLKPQIEITNLNDSWNNQKFGVKQTLHPEANITLGGEFYDLTETPNGDKRNDRAWIVENQVQVIGLGDKVVYDISEGAPYISSIDMVYEDNTSKLILDYRNEANEKPGIGPGETWILDPVYGEPRDWYSRSLYDNTNNDQCDGFVDGGIARYMYKYSTAVATSDCYRTVISWYADWIPKTADIQKVSHVFSQSGADGAYPNYVDIVLLAPNLVPYRNVDNTAPPVYSQMGQNCDEIYGVNSHQAPTQGPGLYPDIRNTVLAYGLTGGDTGDPLTRGFDSNNYNQEYDITAGHAGYRADEILEQRLSNGISNWDICLKQTEDDPGATGPFSEATGTTHYNLVTDNNYPDFTLLVEYTLPLPTKPTTSVVTNQPNLKEVKTIVNSTTWSGTYGEALDVLGYVWKRTTTGVDYEQECHEPFVAGCGLVTRVGFDGPANGLRDLVIGNLTGIVASSNSTIGLENLVVEFDFDKSTSGVLFYDNFQDNSYVEDWIEVTDPNNEMDEVNQRLEVNTDHVENADSHRFATQDRFVSSTGIYTLTWYEKTPTSATGHESYMYLACGDATWDDDDVPNNAIALKNKVNSGGGDGVQIYNDGSLIYSSLTGNMAADTNFKIVYDDNTNEINTYHWGGSSWGLVGTGETQYAELNDDAQGCGVHWLVYDDSSYTGITTIWTDNIYLLDKDFDTQYPTIIYNQATIDSFVDNTIADLAINDGFSTYVNQTVRQADIDLDFTEYTTQLEFDDAWITSDSAKVQGNVTDDNIRFTGVTRDSSEDIISYPLGFELGDNWKATWEMDFTTNSNDPLMWIGFRDVDGSTPFSSGATGDFVGLLFRGTGASGGAHTSLCAYTGSVFDGCYPGGANPPDDTDTFDPIANSTTYYFELEAKDGDYELNIYNNPLKTLPDVHGNHYTTSVLTNGDPLLGTAGVTNIDNFVIFNYPNDSAGGDYTGTLDNLKIYRGTDTYATPDYEKEPYLVDKFRYYSDNKRVANFTDNFSVLDTDGDGNNDWQQIGTTVSVNTGLSEPALEWETDSDADHGVSITLLPDNDRNASGSFLGTSGDSIQGDGVTVSDDAWTLRFKLDIDTWTESAATDETLFIGLSDSDVGTPVEQLGGYSDAIGMKINIDNSGASQFGIIAQNNGWQAAVNDDDYIPIPDPDIGGWMSELELMRVVPAEGVYYVELSRTSHQHAQLCLYFDQSYEVYNSDTKIRECIIANLDPGIIDLDTLKIQTRSDGSSSTNVASGTIDDIQFYDKTHTIGIPNDKETPLPHDSFDLYSTTVRTGDAVWGQSGTSTIEDGTTYTNQTNFDASWVTNDINKARGNVTSNQIEINHVYDESNDAISFDLGTISDDSWTLRFKTNFSNITAGANTTSYFGIFDKDSTVDVDSIHDGIGFTLVHDSNPQTLDLLHVDTLEGAAISNISGTVTVSVTTSVNHNMTTGQMVHIEDTTNFDVEYVPITVVTATSFTYEDPGHGTPETVGKVIPAWMEFDPANPTFIQGWSQVGTLVEVEDGRIHHDAVPKAADHRVFKELSQKLNDEKWTIEFEFEVDTMTASAQVCVICLTSESATGVENPYLTAPVQDMVGFEHYYNNGIRLIYKDDGGAVVRGTEADGGATTTIITDDVVHYGTLKRLDASTIELSVFTDASRTTHDTDSPRYIKIPETIQDLSFIQSSSDEQTGAGGVDSLFVDNISVYNNWNGYENDGILSGTERGMHTIQALDLDNYTKNNDDVRIWNGDYKEIWEPVGSNIGVKVWEPVENTDYWIEISRLSPISYETTVFTDANYTEQIIKVSGVSSNNTSSLQYFKIATDDNLGTGQLTFSVDDLEFFDSTHTVNIPIEATTTDIWGTNANSTIEDFSTYVDEADSDASWISDNEPSLDVDLVNDRLNWDVTVQGGRDRVYYDMGVLNDEQFALRYHMNVGTDIFNGTSTNLVEVFFGVSDDTTETNANMDFIGFQFIKDDSNTETTQLVWSNENDLESPTNIYEFELKPEVDDYYVQLSRSNSTEYSVTFFSDSYYTTAIESMNATIPAAIDSLRYFYVGVATESNAENNINGWIDDIQLYNGTQDSRTLGEAWLQEMESNQLFIDLDRENIYFDLTDNQEPKGISYQLPDEASDNTWALRFEVNLENLVQGPESGWANSNQFVYDGTSERCTITSQSTDGWGLAFNNEGTKMFITNSGGSDDVYEYALNTPWDVSTCTFVDQYDQDAETGETLPTHIEFNPDGTKMYIVGYTLDTVEEFNCATGFDISTCSDALSPLAIGGTMGTNVYGGMTWSPNGEKLFIAEDVASEYLYEWDCAAWDVSTCTYSGNALLLTGGGVTPEGIAFNYHSNGGDLPGYSDKYNPIKLYVSDAGGDEMNTYICEDDLFTADGSIADCVYEDRIGGLSANPRQMAFNPDGTKMYYHAWNGYIEQYSAVTDPGVALFVGLSDQDASEQGRYDQDFVGFVHRIHAEDNYIELRDTEGGSDTEAPWDRSGERFVTVPETGKLFVQLERVSPIKVSMTLFSDASYTTAIESVDQPVSLDTKNLDYIRIFTNGDTTESTLDAVNEPPYNQEVGFKVDGYIDNIQFFNSTDRWPHNDEADIRYNAMQQFKSNTQESRAWAHEWYPQDEDKIYVDLDNDAIYFNAKRDNSDDSISRHIETLDAQTSLRGSLDITSAVQGADASNVGMFIGLTSDEFNSTVAKDWAGFILQISSGQSAYYATTCDKTTFGSCTTSQFTRTLTEEKLWFDISIDNDDGGEESLLVTLFSDANYTTPVEYQRIAMPAQQDYVEHFNYPTSSQTGGLAGWIDSIFVSEETNTVIPGATPLDDLDDRYMYADADGIRDHDEEKAWLDLTQPEHLNESVAANWVLRFMTENKEYYNSTTAGDGDTIYNRIGLSDSTDTTIDLATDDDTVMFGAVNRLDDGTTNGFRYCLDVTDHTDRGCSGGYTTNVYGAQTVTDTSGSYIPNTQVWVELTSNSTGFYGCTYTDATYTTLIDECAIDNPTDADSEDLADPYQGITGLQYLIISAGSDTFAASETGKLDMIYDDIYFCNDVESMSPEWNCANGVNGLDTIWIGNESATNDDADSILVGWVDDIEIYDKVADARDWAAETGTSHINENDNGSGPLIDGITIENNEVSLLETNWYSEDELNSYIDLDDQVLRLEVQRDNTDDVIYADPFGRILSDNFVFRTHMHIAERTSGSDADYNHIYFGLSDEYIGGPVANVQDSLILEMNLNNSADNFHMKLSDDVAPNSGANFGSINGGTFADGEDYWFEFIRNGDRFSINSYADEDYTVFIEGNHIRDSGVQNLRYITFQNYVTPAAGQDHILTLEFDDMVLYNGISPYGFAATGSEYYSNNGGDTDLNVIGVRNEAYQFDQAEDAIRVPNPTLNMRYDQKHSISTWIHPTNVSGTHTIFSNLDDSVAYKGHELNIENSGLYHYRILSTALTDELRVSTTDCTAIIDEWHHVVVVYDPKDASYPIPTDIEIYQDGVKCSMNTELNTFTAGGSFSNKDSLIGAREVGGVAVQEFQGKIDDFTFFTRALTQGDVLAYYNDGNSIDPITGEGSGKGGLVENDNLLVHYDFDTLQSADRNIHLSGLVDEFSVTSEEDAVQGFTWNNDGTKIFVIGETGDDVNEYLCDTEYLLSSCNHVSVDSVSSFTSDPRDIIFNDSGTKAYIIGYTEQQVAEWNGTAFDFSTFVDSNSDLDISGQETGPQDIAWNDDGSKLFLTGESGDINEYSCTVYDVSTCSFTDVTNLPEITNTRGLEFSADGTNVYVADSASLILYEYNMTSFDASTLEPTGRYFDMTDTIAIVEDVYYRGGDDLYAMDTTGENIHKFVTIPTKSEATLALQSPTITETENFETCQDNECGTQWLSSDKDTGNFINIDTTNNNIDFQLQVNNVSDEDVITHLIEPLTDIFTIRGHINLDGVTNGETGIIHIGVSDKDYTFGRGDAQDYIGFQIRQTGNYTGDNYIASTDADGSNPIASGNTPLRLQIDVDYYWEIVRLHDLYYVAIYSDSDFNDLLAYEAGTVTNTNELHKYIKIMNHYNNASIIGTLNGTINWINVYEGFATYGAVGDAQAHGPNVEQGGYFDQAYELDGVDDYVEINSDILNELDRGTLSMWFKVQDAGTTQCIFCASDSGDSNSEIRLVIDEADDGKVEFSVREAGTYAYRVETTGSSYDDGLWHHVAIVVDTNGNKMYIDGLDPEVETTYITGDATNTSFFDDVNDLDQVSIGKNINNLGDQWEIYGMVDQFKLYERSLNHDEIRTLAESFFVADATFKDKALFWFEFENDQQVGWNLRAADYRTELGTGASLNAYDIDWSADGTILSVLDTDNDAVDRYTCSTSFEVNTCGSVSQYGFTTGPGGEQYFGMKWSDNGNVVYFGDETDHEIDKFTCTTPYNPQYCGNYNSSSTVISATTTSDLRVDHVTNDGQWVITGDTVDLVLWEMTTPHDLSTMVQRDTWIPDEWGTDVHDIEFSNDGTVLWIMRNSGDDLYQYYCDDPWQLYSCDYAGFFFDMGGVDTSVVGLAANEDGTKFYMFGHTGDDVHEFTNIMIENQATIANYQPDVTLEDDFVLDNWIDTDTPIAVNTITQKLDFDAKRDNTDDTSYIDLGVLDKTWTIDFDMNITSMVRSDSQHNALYVVVSDDPGASSVMQDALGFRIDLISGTSILELGDSNEQTLGNIADLPSTWEPLTTGVAYFRISDLNTFDTAADDWNLFTVEIFNDPERTQLIASETHPHDDTIDFLQYFKVSNLDDETGGTNTLIGTIDNLKLYNGIMVGGSTLNGAVERDTGTLTVIQGVQGIRDQTWQWAEQNEYIDLTNTGTETSNILDKAMMYDHSVCMWVKPTPASGEANTAHYLWGASQDGTDQMTMYYQMAVNDWQTYVAWDDNTIDPYINNPTSNILTQGIWTHMCYTYNEDSTTDELTFYVNGIDIASDTGSFAEYDPTNIFLGKSAVSTANGFHGYMDDVAFFPTLLSASQIKQLYNTHLSMDIIEGVQGNGTFVYPWFTLGGGAEHFQEVSDNPNPDFEDDFSTYSTDDAGEDGWYLGYSSGSNHVWDSTGADAFALDFIYGSGSTNAYRTISMDLHKVISTDTPGNGTLQQGSNDYNGEQANSLHVDGDFRLRYSVLYDNIVAGGWSQHWAGLTDCYQGRNLCQSTEEQAFLGWSIYPSGNFMRLQESTNTVLTTASATNTVRGFADNEEGTEFFMDLWTEGDRTLLCGSVSSDNEYRGDMSINTGSETGNGGTCMALNDKDQRLRYLAFNGYYGTTSTGTVDGHYDDIQYWEGGDTLLTSPIGGGVIFNGDTWYTSDPEVEEKYDFERTDEFSGAVWVRTLGSVSTGADDDWIFGKSVLDTTYKGYFFRMVDSGQYSLELANTDTGANRLRVDTDTTWDDGLWHHVVVTYDGSSQANGVRIYVDGVEQPTTIVFDTLTGSILNDENLVIGARGDGTVLFYGGMDDFRLYNTVLTQSQITELTNYRLSTDKISDTDVEPGFDYAYSAAGVNQNGIGEFSELSVPVQPGFTIPDAPSNLTATTFNNDRIDLSWDAPVDDGGQPVTGYKIERENPVSGGFSTLVADTGSTSTTYSNNILLGGTQYNYRVSAINSVGISIPSNTDFAWTDFDPPASLLATPIDDDTIRLTWSAPSGGVPTGYTIEREVGIGGGWSVLYDNWTGGTTYDDDGVTLGQTYNYRAYSTGGTPANSTYSNESDTATLQGADPPSSIVAQVLDVDLDPLNISLSWVDPIELGSNSVITGYEIKRNVDGGAFTTLVANTTAVNAYNDTTVQPNMTYAYKLRTLGDVIGGNDSNATAGILTANYTTIPPNFDAQVLDPDGAPYNITVSWNPPVNDGGSALQLYTLYNSTDGVTYSTWMNTTSTSEIFVAPPIANQTYWFKVSALNGIGYSNNATTFISVASNPSAPINLVLSIPLPDTLPWQINATWSEPISDGGSNIVGYTLWRSTTFNGTYTNVTATDGNTTTYLDTTVPAPSPANQTYWYKVQAENLIGYGVNSTAILINTVAVPLAPNNTLLTIPDPNSLPWQINVAWDTVDNGGSAITGHTIWRSDDGGIVYSNVTSIGNATSFLDTTVPTPSDPNQIYYYKISQKNILDIWGANSTAVSINTVDVPIAPTSVLLSIDDPGSAPYDITVQWTPPTDNGGSALLGYKVFRSLDDVNYIEVGATGNITSIIDSVPVGPSTTYYYKVAATNILSAYGANSTSNSIATGSAPSAPLNLAVAPRADHTSMQLTWDIPASDGGSPIVGYRVDINIDSAGWATVIADTGSTATTYIDTGRTYDTNYNYRVAAITIVGTGPTSATDDAEFTTAVLTPVVTPLAGTTIQFDVDVNMTYGIPDSNIYDVELRYWSSGNLVTQISPAPNDSVAKNGSANYTMWDNIDETTDYYILVKTSNGVGGEFREFQTGKLTATPTLRFNDNLFGTEYRNNTFTGSVLNMVGSPANYDLVVVYREQNNLDNVIVLTWDDVISDVDLTTPVDATKRYYIAGYFNPDFDYTVGASPEDGTATIPVAYPVDISLVSMPDPNQVGLVLGIDTIAGDSGIFGLPIVFIFIIALASIFTGRSAPMGIIFIGVAMGMMAYLGLIDFNFDPANNSNIATWAIIIVAIIIGVMVGKRWD
jgi:hypothetical protein